MRLTFILLLAPFIVFAQASNDLPIANDALKKQIENIRSNEKITADSALTILSTWKKYPEIRNTKRWVLFLYKDPTFGTVPLKIYIPENYKNNISSPAVLLLHGGVALSSFKDAYKKNSVSDEDVFFRHFEKHNFIIIRPFADGRGPNSDGTINFDWAINRFNVKESRNKTNPTFQTLIDIISQLKQILNIDDNKLFAFGHSDGSDGAFSLQLYKPSAFAGFIAYNSLLTNLNSYDIYLRNTINRPLYLVHSDLDDLRPIQQTRLIVKILDSLKSPITYKEYKGYEHEDKHLQIDLPYSYEWIKGINRNSFQKNITWETSSLNYNTCGWLRITQFDTAQIGAKWHTEVNVKSYYKRDKSYFNLPYYPLNKSVAVRAVYNNNTFEISTSRTKEIELLISPSMVNLQNPVIIKINGKKIFDKRIKADKAFLLKKFTNSFDRKALWVTSIKLKTG
jgi:predicted esterase